MHRDSIHKKHNRNSCERFFIEASRETPVPGDFTVDAVPPMKSRKGFGTVEIVLIIAVLISLALLFRSSITAYAKNLMNSVFTDGESSFAASGENADE
jgi:hypothetical protein